MVERGRIETLVARAGSGDRNAFDELVRRCEGRLRSSVLGRLGPGQGNADVDAVIQETFILAFQAMHSFQWRGEASFHAWLARIARNVLIGDASDARRSRYLEITDGVAAKGPSPSQVLRRSERLGRLEAAISELPPHYREVIRLSHLERLKVKEIAQRMGRSEFAVKKLLARALRKLRDAFGHTESLNLPDRPLEVEGGDRGEE